MMKKFLTSLMAILCTVLFVTLSSCRGRENEFPPTGTDKIIVLANDENTFAFQAEKDADGTKSVYDYLKMFEKDNIITFEGYESQFGFYITSLNGKAESFSEDGSSGSYWACYTSVTSVDGILYSNAEYGTEKVGEVEVYSASYGVSGLPVFADGVYLFAYTSY